VRIDIWSDVVCPWCYLGHRRFAKAVEQLPNLEVDVHWRAFELDPRAPREPQPLRSVIERKYGPGTYDTMTQRLVDLGAAEGIDYRFDLAQRTNTFDAHRVLAWAATQPEGQDPIAERFFLAYFTEGRDLANPSTLVDLVSETGGDSAEVAVLLTTDDFAHEVRVDEAQAQEYEVTGVPAFVLADRLMIPGAQDVDTLVRVLERAVERFG
jgi:predicted DsbA family dithiol-disulfide isomerase